MKDEAAKAPNDTVKAALKVQLEQAAKVQGLMKLGQKGAHSGVSTPADAQAYKPGVQISAQQQQMIPSNVPKAGQDALSGAQQALASQQAKVAAAAAAPTAMIAPAIAAGATAGAAQKTVQNELGSSSLQAHKDMLKNTSQKIALTKAKLGAPG